MHSSCLQGIFSLELKKIQHPISTKTYIWGAMKRWDFAKMMNVGSKLFATIHKRKRFANPNHDVHLMARNISEWLTQGVQSLINGTYTPRLLKRHYFKDEMVEQLHLSDRILQNLLLKQTGSWSAVNNG